MTLREEARRRAETIDLEQLNQVATDVHGDRHLGTVWYAGPVVGQVADAASTLLVLHKVPGAREGNPLVAPAVGQPGLFVAGKVAVGAGFSLAAHLLARDGHTRSAKILSGAATFLGVGAAIHNASLLR